MLRNTRTTLANRLVRVLAWNMPVHAEHHAHPTIPFHRLLLLHGRLRARLGATAEGCLAFNRADIARRLSR